MLTVPNQSNSVILYNAAGQPIGIRGSDGNEYLIQTTANSQNYTGTLPGAAVIFNGLWANRPSAALVPAGTMAFFTDIGPAGTMMRTASDSAWHPIGGRALLYNGGADFAMAATSVEQTAYTYTLPAGLWFPNAILLVSYGVEKTVAATDTLTHALKIGGTAIPPSNTMATTTLTGGFQRPIRRVSSTSVQQIGAAANLSAGVAPYGGNGGNISQTRPALTTVTDLDANSNAIILTGKMGTGGADVGNFSGFTIELIG